MGPCGRLRERAPVARAASGLAALAALTAIVAGCSDGPAHPGGSPSPTSPLLVRLDMLPTVDGAQVTAQTTSPQDASRTYRMGNGTPACLQILARLDASGYEVVAGPTPQKVVPGTCQAAVARPATSETAGAATILAAGGSQIALHWTADSYTVEATGA